MAAERSFTDDKVKKIIELKKKVCTDNDKSFVLVNQKVNKLRIKDFLMFEMTK